MVQPEAVEVVELQLGREVADPRLRLVVEADGDGHRARPVLGHVDGDGARHLAARQKGECCQGQGEPDQEQDERTNAHPSKLDGRRQAAGHTSVTRR